MKYISIILLSLISVCGFSQVTPFNRGSSSILARDARVQGYYNLVMPVGMDTTLYGGLDSLGSLIFNKLTRTVYFRDTIDGGHVWTAFGSGGGGGNQDFQGVIDVNHVTRRDNLITMPDFGIDWISGDTNLIGVASELAVFPTTVGYYTQNDAAHFGSFSTTNGNRVTTTVRNSIGTVAWDINGTNDGILPKVSLTGMSSGTGYVLTDVSVAGDGSDLQLQPPSGGGNQSWDSTMKVSPDLLQDYNSNFHDHSWQIDSVHNFYLNGTPIAGSSASMQFESGNAIANLGITTGSIAGTLDLTSSGSNLFYTDGTDIESFQAISESSVNKLHLKSTNNKIQMDLDSVASPINSLWVGTDGFVHKGAISGGLQTWQQTLIVPNGSILTQNNTISVGSHLLSFTTPGLTGGAFAILDVAGRTIVGIGDMGLSANQSRIVVTDQDSLIELRAHHVVATLDSVNTPQNIVWKDNNDSLHIAAMPGSGTNAAWLLASGGSLTGVNNITNTAISGLNWHNVATFTANNQFLEGSSGTATARATAADVFTVHKIYDTLVWTANTQEGILFDLAPTFTKGAFTLPEQTVIRSAGNINPAGSGLWNIGRTANMWAGVYANRWFGTIWDANGNNSLQINLNGYRPMSVIAATQNIKFGSITTTTVDSLYKVDINGDLKVSGGISVAKLPTPVITSITNQGTAGSTTYTYVLIYRDIEGNVSGASAPVTTTTGNATLTPTNFNRINFSGAETAGLTAYYHDLYRTVGGATQGKVATSAGYALSSTDDIGSVGDGTTAPVNNNSGNIGVGILRPTAGVDIRGGVADVSGAPLKIRSGTVLTVTEAGAIENDGTHLYYTAANAGTRYQLDQQGGGGGTVISVSGTANQIASTGGTTPVLSLVSGGTLPGAWILGTPASVTLTNGTGLPISTGLTGGATNRVPYFTSATALSTSSAFLFDGTNLGIGATPQSLVTVSKQTTIQAPVSGSAAQFVGLDANPLRITFDTHNNSSGSGTAMMGRRSRGTAGTPLALAADDVIFSINGRGYGTTQYAAASTGLLTINANQTFTDANNGTYVSISTTPDNSVTAAEALRVTGAGVINAIQSGGKYQINSTDVLTSTTLGSGVIGSSLTSFGANPVLGVASSTSESITGTGGNGFLQIANQSSNPSTPTTSGRIFFDNSNRLSWKGANGFVRTLDGTASTADRVYTLPDAAGTIVLNDNTAALTNKTYNGNTWTAGTGVLTIAASKTFTANNTLTLAGTDGTTMTFPTTSATLARTDAGNAFTGAQSVSGAGSALTVSGSTQVFAVGTGTYPFRTTNGGSNINSQSIFDVDASASVAGSQAFTFETATGFGFTHANGTRRILGAALKLTNLTNTAGSEASDLSLYTQSAGTALTEKLRITAAGGLVINATNTATGTTGNQTINKPSGTVNIAAGGTTVTVTNSLVTTSSLVLPVIRTNDATATIKNIVPGSGSFVITLTAAATAEVSIGFFVLN